MTIYYHYQFALNPKSNLFDQNISLYSSYNIKTKIQNKNIVFPPYNKQTLPSLLNNQQKQQIINKSPHSLLIVISKLKIRINNGRIGLNFVTHQPHQRTNIKANSHSPQLK
jgi:hypothetical protein